MVILYLSGGPGVSLPSSWADLFSVDKFAHAVVYAILTFLLLVGYHRQKEKQVLSIVLLLSAVFGSSFYGFLMELMQYFVFPGRFFEVMDIIANIIGSFIGLFFYTKFKSKIPTL